MSSFINAGAHDSLLVLLSGLVTFFGCVGLGLILLRLLRADLPAPFHQVVAALLGVQAIGAAVQAAAMLHVATPALLVALWCASCACGIAGLAFLRHPTWSIGPSRVPWPAIAVAAVACGANFVAAVVPSSKIDELYYHMLLPSRIVADHGLVFYRMPIESAILPQMGYQILAAPLHALGFPDAPNIVSWLLSLMLVWAGWLLLRQRGVTATASYCLVAAIPAGAYPVVFHVTGGSHAFGDVALAIAVVALATGSTLWAASGPVVFAFAVSLLSWCAASSKLSLVPIAVAALALGGLQAWRSVGSGSARLRIVAALAAPWLVLGAPLMIWTYAQSGSPFGPFLAGDFGASLYDTQTFKDFAEGTRQANRSPLGAVIFDNLAAYSPLIWFATIGVLLSKSVPSQVRLWGAILLFGQLLIVAWLLPYHARFLGGLQYGLALCFALYCAQRIANLGRVAAFAFALGLAPWLAGQVYYAQQFSRTAAGLESRDVFFRRYIAFYDDFVRLDRLLPQSAILLTVDFRAPAVYAPRPIVFDAEDIAPGREVFLFGAAPPNGSDTFGKYAPVENVYFNPESLQEVYRRSWIPPLVGELHVTRLASTRPSP